MKKSKSLIALLIVFAIVTLGLGITSTVSSVEAGKQYKEGISAYNQFADAEDEIIAQYAEKQAAHAYSQSKSAEVVKKQLFKSFSISLLMYLAFAICVVLIVLQYTKKTE